MSIEAVCQKDVISIRDTATLREVSRLMRIRHVSSVVVTRPYDGRRIPTGIVTDRDLAISLGTAIRPQDLPVHQIIRQGPVTIRLNDSVQDAVHLMLKSGVERLPVVDQGGSLVGVVRSHDLLKLLGEEIRHVSRVLENEILNEKGDPIPFEAMAYL